MLFPTTFDTTYNDYHGKTSKKIMATNDAKKAERCVCGSILRPRLPPPRLLPFLACE